MTSNCELCIYKKKQKVAAAAPIEALSHHVPYGTKEKPQKNLSEDMIRFEPGTSVI
jgi:hypothetical protein